jgi:hypothetical protein
LSTDGNRQVILLSTKGNRQVIPLSIENSHHNTNEWGENAASYKKKKKYQVEN